jgi:long-chain acyl-CoA synthetase
MAYPSIPQCFLEAVDRFRQPRAQIYNAGDRWESVSAEETLRRVAGLSEALRELGVREGDRVGLFSPNRPEWAVSDYAILGLGAVSVPIYFRESPDRMVYILNHSGAKVVIVAGEEQIRRFQGVRERLEHVEQVIVAGAPAELDPDLLRYEPLVARVSEESVVAYRGRAAAIKEGQLASIIYTSGTTGEPKGVMLTHANFSSNATDSVFGLNYGVDDVALEFLPLSHVYERIMGYGYMIRGVAIAYVENMEQVPQALLEVRPTLFASVPRFWEKFYATMMDKGRAAGGVRSKIFAWAIRVAAEAAPWRAHGRSVSPLVKAKWFVANWLVYPKIRAGLGGRVRSVSAGSAPLARELGEFFWSIGVDIYQGYGLTETSPVVSTNYPGHNKVGTVGPIIPNVEARIAEDGEILVRGPNVMRGYYLKPEETRAVLSADGWLRTGDIGILDADGYLSITDRKKELIKTAAGKFVAPQPIENCLKSSSYIASAVVVGDKRKFICALIVPDFAAVQSRASEMGLQFSSHAELAGHPWVHELLTGEVQRLTTHLAQYEGIKRFAVLDHDFSYDGGELTHTLKLKRRVIEQQYSDVIEQLYADVEEPRPAPLT